MKNRLLFLMLGAALIACNKETPIDDTGETDEPDDTGDTEVIDNDDFETALELEFDGDGVAILDDVIDEAGDRDFFSIEATEGMYYMLWASRDNVDPGEPDTTIKLYDSAETFLGENDDMPHRWYDTDAGYIFRATVTGTYYVEVREWTDWEPEEAYPAEGADYFTYQMIAYEYDGSEMVSPNDTLVQAQAALDTLKNVDEADNEYSYYSDPWGAGYGFATGHIDSATDVDLFGSWADAAAGTYTGEVCQWSMYPDLPSALGATFTLTDAAGNVVSQTTDVDSTPDYNFFYGAGITFPIGAAGGDYFLEVSDDDGTFGADHYYAMINVCYPATYVPETGTPYVQVSIATEGVDTNVSMRQGTGSWFGRFSGFLDDGSDVDTFKVIDGVSTATRVSLWMDVVDAGSEITDTQFAMYDGTTAINGSTQDGANPFVEELAISASGTLNIEISSLGGYSGGDAYYHGLIIVED